MEPEGTVTIEFFGVPRHHAGRAELAVPAGTVAQVLSAARLLCPGLAGVVEVDGSLASPYLLSLDGIRFTRNEKASLRAGTRVLLLAADAGG